MTGKNGLLLHADDLRERGLDVAATLATLDPKKAEELLYNFRFWARPEQIPPDGDWNTFMILAGRGFGKTWAGAQWCREQAKKGKRRIMAVAATNSDIERVMIKGESGFLTDGDKGDVIVSAAGTNWVVDNLPLVPNTQSGTTYTFVLSDAIRIAVVGSNAAAKNFTTPLAAFVSYPLGSQIVDRKSTRLNSSHVSQSRMPSSA